MTFLMDRIRLFFSGDERSLIVKKNAVFSICLKGISILVSFMLVPLTIGYVSQELYGVWLTLSSMVVWLGFLDIGFSQGLKNRLAEANALNDWDRGKRLVSTTYFLMVLIFVPLGILAQFIVPLIDWCSLLNISEIYRDDVIKSLRVLVALTCLQQISNVLVGVAFAFQKVAFSNSFLVLGNVISLIIIWLLTKYVPSSLLNLCFSIAAMPILVTIVASVFLYRKMFRRVRPSIKFIDLNLYKDLFGLGYKFFIINIQVVVLFQSTNMLISYVSSPKEVAEYNVAYKLLNCAMMVFFLVTAPLRPAYTDAYTRKDFPWMNKMRKKMGRILMLSIGACAILTAMSRPIYSIWIGDKVDVSFTMTLAVFIYVAVYCWSNLNGTLIVGMGKLKMNTMISLVGMFAHIPISLFLSKYLGAYGVLVSLVGINFFYAVMQHIQASKLINQTASGSWDK